MRYLLLAPAVALMPQASAAEKLALAPAVESPRPVAHTECRTPTSFKANTDIIWRGDGIAPSKLTELPPAQGYMAVYRTVNGCELPMTVVEYRAGRRP